MDSYFNYSSTAKFGLTQLGKKSRKKAVKTAVF